MMTDASLKNFPADSRMETGLGSPRGTSIAMSRPERSWGGHLWGTQGTEQNGADYGDFMGFYSNFIVI